MWTSTNAIGETCYAMVPMPMSVFTYMCLCLFTMSLCGTSPCTSLPRLSCHDIDSPHRVSLSLPVSSNPPFYFRLSPSLEIDLERIRLSVPPPLRVRVDILVCVRHRHARSLSRAHALTGELFRATRVPRTEMNTCSISIRSNVFRT